MKNTRLYFDKDFKPITKLTLSFRLPGATPNFETDMDVIVKGNATGVDDIPTWIGTTRKVCESQTGHSFDDILATPSLLTDQQNSTEADYDVFLKGEQGSTLASLEVIDGMPNTIYNDFINTGDIQYRLQSADSVEITDHEGNPVVVDPNSGFILRIFKTTFPALINYNPYIFFETSLAKILRMQYNPITAKWYKIKLRYTAGIVLSEKAKVYFETDESSEIKQRTATYYIVNTDYQAPQP